MDRRNFLKGAATIAGATIIDPKVLYSKPDRRKDAACGQLSLMPAQQFDVIVAGAGPGGIPAAIRAAQHGAKVALVEEDMAIGGAPVDMFVDTLFGGPVRGFAKSLGDELLKEHDLYNYEAPTKPKGWRFHLPSAFSRVLTDRILAEKNITLFCGTPVIGVHVSPCGNRTKVTGVRIFRGGALQDLMASVTVDATGNGVVSAMAGCEYMYGSEAKSDFGETYGFDERNGKVQPCTQMFISERIRRDAIFPEGFKGSAAEDGYVGANRLSKEELENRATGIFFHWGQTIEVKDTRDPVQLADAQRECLLEYRDRFKQLFDAGFAVHIAPKLGVRECRRIKGEYVITANNVLEGIFEDDTVALAKYNMDCWGLKGMLKVPTKLYGIPYRSLVPLGMEGLLTAGRIISGTRLAHSSYRVQRICSNIGEASGVAAAMASLAKTSVRDVDITKLQDALGKYGLLKR